MARTNCCALSRDGTWSDVTACMASTIESGVLCRANGQLVIAEERRQSLVIVMTPIDRRRQLSSDRFIEPTTDIQALDLRTGKEDNKRP